MKFIFIGLIAATLLAGCPVALLRQVYPRPREKLRP